MKRVRPDPHDRPIFFVHLFNNPDILSAADEVVVSLIPRRESYVNGILATIVPRLKRT